MSHPAHPQHAQYLAQRPQPKAPPPPSLHPRSSPPPAPRRHRPRDRPRDPRRQRHRERHHREKRSRPQPVGGGTPAPSGLVQPVVLRDDPSEPSDPDSSAAAVLAAALTPAAPIPTPPASRLRSRSPRKHAHPRARTSAPAVATTFTSPLSLAERPGSSGSKTSFSQTPSVLLGSSVPSHSASAVAERLESDPEPLPPRPTIRGSCPPPARSGEKHKELARSASASGSTTPSRLRFADPPSVEQGSYPGTAPTSTPGNDVDKHELYVANTYFIPRRPAPGAPPTSYVAPRRERSTSASSAWGYLGSALSLSSGGSHGSAGSSKRARGDVRPSSASSHLSGTTVDPPPARPRKNSLVPSLSTPGSPASSLLTRLTSWRRRPPPEDEPNNIPLAGGLLSSPPGEVEGEFPSEDMEHIDDSPLDIGADRGILPALVSDISNPVSPPVRARTYSRPPTPPRPFPSATGADGGRKGKKVPPPLKLTPRRSAHVPSLTKRSPLPLPIDDDWGRGTIYKTLSPRLMQEGEREREREGGGNNGPALGHHASLIYHSRGLSLDTASSLSRALHLPTPASAPPPSVKSRGDTGLKASLANTPTASTLNTADRSAATPSTAPTSALLTVHGSEPEPSSTPGAGAGTSSSGIAISVPRVHPVAHLPLLDPALRGATQAAGRDISAFEAMLRGFDEADKAVRAHVVAQHVAHSSAPIATDGNADSNAAGSHLRDTTTGSPELSRASVNRL